MTKKKKRSGAGSSWPQTRKTPAVSVLRRKNKPDLVVPLEDAEQTMIFSWAARYKHQIPALENMFAVPNEGKRSPGTAGRYLAMGLRSGIPDIYLDYPACDYHGLRIELKRVAFELGSKWGTLSDNQKIWIERLNAAGYLAVVCRGHEHAIATISAYLKDNKDELDRLKKWAV